MSTAWTSRYAQRTKGIQSSAIRELLKFTQRPEVISFAGGLPASEVFPTERFREAGCKVLETKAHLALQYGATEAYEPLREMVARHIARYGIKAKSENVLISPGPSRRWI
jgi:2-aminoadipate transaminase